MSYTWKHLKAGPYVAVVVSVLQEPGHQALNLQPVPLYHDMNIVYHRSQMQDKYSLCRYLRLPASFGKYPSANYCNLNLSIGRTSFNILIVPHILIFPS